MTRPTIDMMEVTRLTRLGRLDDAMATLRGERPCPPAANRDHPASWTRPHCDGAGITGEMPQRSPRTLFGRAKSLQVPPGLNGTLGRTAFRSSVAVPDGARFEGRVFANGAGSRPYKLYVPSGCNGQALPLVVMLHGCTQSPDDFAAGTRMNDLAEEQLFLVAYPAQTQSANPSKCWNWFSADDQIRDQGEPALIAGITREIMREFPVVPERVYVAGLSAGGAAAAIMGSAYPDLYAAVGVHSGLACGAARDMPSAFAAMRQGASPSRQAAHRQGIVVPTIVFHGDSDTTVNPVNADQVASQAKGLMDLHATLEQGIAPGGLRYSRTVHAAPDGEPALEQWVIHGAGHAWSGGSDAGTYTDPRGPDASREMVRFFLATSRTDEGAGIAG